jgi:diguanylate cyclase (GGDEF)-like protein/PAS domain S-box-containing protein
MCFEGENENAASMNLTFQNTRNVAEKMIPPADSEGLASTLLESLPDAVIATGLTGEIRYLNLAATRLLGMSRNAARGRPLAEALTMLDGATRRPIASPLTRFLSRDGASLMGEHDVLVRRDGAETPIDDATALVYDERGEAIGMVIVLRDATRTREAMRQLVHRATHDGLTRLVNRSEFERRLACLLAGMGEGEAHTLLYMDLDGFKAINDACGRVAGDMALQQVADLFRAAVRERDTLARLGGDEFGLLLEHCPPEQAMAHARRLHAALADSTFLWQGRRFPLAVSIGLAAITGRVRDTADILTAADRACYAAKQAREEAPRIRLAADL